MTSTIGNAPRVPRETVQRLFARAVETFGDRPLVISDADGSVFTYADTGTVVRRVASALSTSGVHKGDRICVCAPAHVESYLLFWAAVELGVIFVPLDFSSPERMVACLLALVKPKLLFCDGERASGFPSIPGSVPTVVFDNPGQEGIPGTTKFSLWLDAATDDTRPPDLLPEDDAAILFTSGSTGEPKGVVLSQRALFRRGFMMSDLFGWRATDLFLSHADPHVVTGLLAGVNPLHIGASFLITPLSRRANALSVAACIKDHRCTLFMTAPVALRQFVQFKDRIDPDDVSSLRSIVCAGSALSQDTADEFMNIFKVPVLPCYGMSEVGWVTVQTLSTYRNAADSVGIPVSTIEIIGTDGQVLKDNETGELRLRNDQLMTGYYRQPELTAAFIRDGWVYTGDLALRRPDGHIVLKGRIKNIIKNANGDLISLEEVELALEKHPQVREAAVCGFLSSRGDERLAAFIVPSPGVVAPQELFRELRRHIRAELGPYKVPAEFIMKDALPRNNFGKVLREQLRPEIVES